MQNFRWIIDHWQSLLGWITGLVTLWKTGRFFSRLIISINNVFERFVSAEQTLTLVATNHLPHLQAEMERMNEGLSDLQDKAGKSNDTLTEIAVILRERN